MVACRVAQEIGGLGANYVNALIGITKLQFHAFIRSFVIPYPNNTKLTVELPSIQDMPYFTFKRIPLAIHMIRVSKFCNIFFFF